MIDPKKTNESISEKVMASVSYIPIEDQIEMDNYLAYLNYRVLQDIYKICKLTGQIDDILWDEYVNIMYNQRTKQSAAAIAIATLQEFLKNGYFNFGGAPKGACNEIFKVSKPATQIVFITQSRISSILCCFSKSIPSNFFAKGVQ